jgi:hypothetical protein
MATCTHITDAAKCASIYYPGHDWEMCRWIPGPKLVAYNRRCNDITRLQISYATRTFEQCDKACSDDDRCVTFVFGRRDYQFYNKCYLQSYDRLNPSSCKLTGHNPYWDTWWPTRRATPPSTTPNKCTHARVF